MNASLRQVLSRPNRGWALVPLLVVTLSGASLLAMSATAGDVAIESAIVSADQLTTHGVQLKAVPTTVVPAKVVAETARATARQLVGAAKDPEETHRVFASETYLSTQRTAWLFLFVGGAGPVSAGPPEGADSRTYTTGYTGVLIDDQTGEVLRWFQGGSFTP